MKIKITPFVVLSAIVLVIIIFILLGFLLLIFIKSLSTTMQIILLISMIVFAAIYDLFVKRKSKKENSIFLEITQHLLANDYLEFQEFTDLYKSNYNKFQAKNEELVKRNNYLDFKKLQPVELLYLFQHSKQKICITDWKGEENDFEIQAFLETILNNPFWEYTTTFRKTVYKKNVGDNQYLIGLLKSIDKDLQINGYKLLFLNMN